MSKRNGKKQKGKAPKKTNILKAKLSTPRMKGRGGFVADIGKGVGSWLGGKAADLFTKITGIGDYSVSHNTLTNPNNPPVLSNTRSATRVQHREFITDVYSTIGFTVTSYPINPGLVSTFPWLAAVASSFEQYRMHGLIFEYKSTSAVALNSTNTALGTVIQATEYDATKPAFQDKRSMENYVYSTSGPPSVSSMHPVECARQVNVLDDLYVRGGPTDGTTDLRFSDLGTYQLATVGMQEAGVIIGELWVTFDIELIKPRLPSSITAVPSTHYVYDSTLYPGSGAPTNSNLFGKPLAPKMTLLGTSTTPVILDTSYIGFPTPGTYLVYMRFVGSATAIGTFSVAFQSGTAYGSGSLLSYFHNGGGTSVDSYQMPAAAVSTTTVVAAFACTVSTASTVTPATVLVDFGTLVASVVGADLTVVSLPAGFAARPRNLETLFTRLAMLEKRLADDHDEKDMVICGVPLARLKN